MGTSTQRKQDSSYQQPIEQVLAELGTDPQKGLSTAEARRALGRAKRIRWIVFQ